MMHCIRLFTLVLSVILIIGLSIWGCVESCLLPAFASETGNNPTASPVDVTPSATPTTAETLEPGSTIKPTLTPEPTPEPTPIVKLINGIPATEVYQDSWPLDIGIDLKYDKYEAFPSYFVALKTANVRQEPSTGSTVLKTLSYGQRIQLLATVEVDGKTWYYVKWNKSGTTYNGYISKSTGIPRIFRLETMLERINKLKHVLDSGKTVYISNYKNAHGSPPRHPYSSSEDSYGYQRYQSAPGYVSPDAASEFRYVPDGMLGIVEDEYEDFAKIYFPTFDQSLWVPNKYLSKEGSAIDNLSQVIVVDRVNQNSAVFQLEDGVWNVISMSFVSTGKTSYYALPTPLGDFMAIERRNQFLYYADGTTTIDGYAPYAIRFSGGGYLHGVPRRYSRTDAGALIDPGMSESLSTLGTYPTSHMCVRNYTSQAKFLYDWVDIGNCAVIVIE